MEKIKVTFETVVRENSAWLYSFLRTKTRNAAIVEDLLQEIWIKAYRAYDSYNDDGHLKAWLYRIAINHFNSYYSKAAKTTVLSLDFMGDNDDALLDMLTDGISVEDEYIENELIGEIMNIIRKLPKSEQQIISYRFIDGYSVAQTAQMMNIPQGTVKSKTHYAIGEIRKTLNIIPEKGVTKMKCNDIIKYLFIYANETITDDAKKLVEAHLKECKRCKDIVDSLKKLIPTMTFAPEDTHTHFIINFPELNICYVGVRNEIEGVDTMNEMIKKWDGIIPDDYYWFGQGFTKGNELLAIFDNEGNEIEFVKFDETSTHFRTKATKVKKAFKYMWLYSVINYNNEQKPIRRSKEAPNLYYGNMSNAMGAECKSALYQAVSGNAENLRIKRGNGIIDCGAFKFPYSDRYLTEDEVIRLEFSFLIG